MEMIRPSLGSETAPDKVSFWTFEGEASWELQVDAARSWRLAYKLARMQADPSSCTVKNQHACVLSGVCKSEPAIRSAAPVWLRAKSM